MAENHFFDDGQTEAQSEEFPGVSFCKQRCSRGLEAQVTPKCWDYHAELDAMLAWGCRGRLQRYTLTLTSLAVW